MKCEKCGGRLLLALATVYEFYPDSEPFGDGVAEEVDPVKDEVCVGIHYCPDCCSMHDAWIESPVQES